jgi:integrase
VTVFRPSRRTRTTPSWYYRFTAGGIAYEKGGYPTKKAAQAGEWRRRGEAGARQPWHEPPRGAGPTAPLAAHAEAWLAELAGHVARGALAPRTLQSYRDLYDRHILPALGRRPLGSLTRTLLEAFLNAKRQAGLSKNTVRLLRSALSSLCTDALERGDLLAHPLAGSGRRRQRTSEAERTVHIRPMTREQRDAFLATAGAGGQGPLFELLAKTGLRPGEAFALQVGDVDLEGGVLRVERAWDGQSARATKTHQRRVVDLTPGLVERLRVATTSRRRVDNVATAWLFPDAAGQPLNIFRVHKVFWRTLRAAGLPRFRLYDLRHTYATLRLLDGAPVLYVAGQLGHRDPATTLRHYARWVPSTDRRWVEQDGGTLVRSRPRGAGIPRDPRGAVGAKLRAIRRK